MKLAIRVPVGLPGHETAEFIQRCEDAGFSGVGVVDHQHSGRDVFMTLALAAQCTSTISLFPAVTNPVSRHAMVLASVAHTLEEMAPGRVYLPVGAGFLAMHNINRRSATVREMRTVVANVRGLLSGESVYPGITDGKMTRVTNPATPVYVCATGPRMVEVAGEVGDGAFLMIGMQPKVVTKAKELLAQGAKRAGRDSTNLPIILACPMHLDDDLKAAREWGRRLCFQWATEPLRSHWLKEMGIAHDDITVPEDISEELLGQICDAIGLFGPPDYCLERLHQLEEETGVNRVFVQPTVTYDMPNQTIEIFKKTMAGSL